MKKKITLIILLVLVGSDILETFTQFCFKKSALLGADFAVIDRADYAAFLATVFASPYLWIGLLSVSLTFVLWSTVLSKIDLSVAVPIASFSYILVPLVSIIFLGERIELLHWIGIIFILTGVIFVSSSSKEKEKEIGLE